MPVVKYSIYTKQYLIGLNDCALQRLDWLPRRRTQIVAGGHLEPRQLFRCFLHLFTVAILVLCLFPLLFASVLCSYSLSLNFLSVHPVYIRLSLSSVLMVTFYTSAFKSWPGTRSSDPSDVTGPTTQNRRRLQF